MKKSDDVLQAAIKLDREALIKALTEGKEVEGRDRDGRTAIFHAVISERIDLLADLIEAGAKVDVADHSGWTPLHFAAQSQNPDLVQILTDNHAPIDAQDEYGNTPLFRAVFSSKGYQEVILLLVKLGANPDRTNNYGVSPRSLAGSIANYDLSSIFDSAGK